MAARSGLDGIVHLPPPVPDPLPKLAASVGAGLLAGAALLTILRKRSHPADFERAHSCPPHRRAASFLPRHAAIYL